MSDALREKTAPLVPGERLSRAEFERRYEASPNIRKAELIEGVVHMPSPVRFEHHAEPHIQIATWLNTYATFTPGLRAGDNASVRLDKYNEFQPDALLMVEGGQARLAADDYVAGPPELIVEISASTTPHDLTQKMAVYQRTGVLEYIIWQTETNDLTWYHLREGHYHPLPLDPDGLIESRTFPGLRLALKALLTGDMPTVLTTLQAGLNTGPHAAYIEKSV